MSTTHTVRIHAGLPVGVPRAADRVGRGAAWLMDALRTLSRAMAPTAHYPRFARDVPAAERASAEAARVRRMAFELGARDPAFAADLYAAADRHERLHGVE